MDNRNSANSLFENKSKTKRTLGAEPEDVLDRLKNKCFERIKSKRKSMLDERRKSNLQRAMTQSKLRKEAKEVTDELAADYHELMRIVSTEADSILDPDFYGE